MTVVTVGVADAELTSVVLYTPLPWPMRLDLLPFLFLYVTAVYLYMLRPEDDVLPWIFGACSVFWHALALLSTEWSVDVRCWMSCSRLTAVVADERLRVLAKVEPALAMLPKQLCDCHMTLKEKKETSKDQLVPTLWFLYQNVKFCLYEDVDTINCSNDSKFRRLEFPSSGTLESYLQSKGIISTKELQEARGKWGRNDFELPMPKFAELLKEQLVAPFFVFQFFCMLLWCLDEYMYYSLLTLLMLVIFECTVVKQRQQNMDTLLHMRRPPQPCLVFRSGRWGQVLSDDLVPGDICSVGHNGHEHDAVVPCDILLLRGNCVVNESMLSGESIPLRKEAVGASIVNEEDKLTNLEIDNGSSMMHKRHVLYGGTRILQHTTPLLKDMLRVSATPDGGSVGFVLKTGFCTTQGSLMRTILYSSQRVTANNSEAMWFIALLLNFAVAAAAFVLAQGFNDPTRNHFKLFLHCIMIITSVVPPELPMELSLAVTNSLIALTRSNIFCTEPFRIPAAGRIDICCFDKTGTLTSDELKLRGVAGLKMHEKSKDIWKHRSELDIIASEQLPLDTELILAGCQSLVLLNGQVVGDALEVTAVRNIKWYMTSREGEEKGLLSLQPSFYSDRRGEIQEITILRSFAFSSELKRMTTVVCVRKADEQDEQRVLTKGAPEVLESIFTDKPSYYRRAYRHYASKGCRVLALGFRVLPVEISSDELRRKSRSELESALTFAGFMILDCPLKDDTKRTIRELMVSKHRVIMVTGDSPLTACDVARQVGIIAGYSKQPLILTPNAEAGSVEWKSIDDGSPDVKEETVSFNVDEVEKVQVQNDLCVTGEALAVLYKQQKDECNDNATALERFLTILEKMCLCTTVFARTSPQQKEYLIVAMNRCGKTTAMCGDGTNDVGALKQAHIGISIVNSSTSESHPHVVDTGRGSGNTANRDGLRHRRQPGRGGHSMNELQQPLYGGDDAQIVRLGDASIASPFTSKSSSIRVIMKLIRQGRCTLVTTIQVYKILGINCLITAYYLSSLFVLGVKNGDQQLTISGLSIAMFFLFMSRAKPARKLSHQRPPSGVFRMSVMMSIFGQFVIHLAFLAAALHLAQPFIKLGDPAMHPDGKFTPNVINSIMFLMSSIMQVNTFVVNYRGQPFMEGFWENKLLYRSALFNYAVLAIATAEVFTPVNSMLELVPMPNKQTQLAVAALMAGDTIVTLAFEHAVQMIAYVSG